MKYCQMPSLAGKRSFRAWERFPAAMHSATAHGPEPAEIPVGAGPFREMLHDRDDDAEIVPRQDFPAHEEAFLLQGFPVGLRPALRDFETAVVEGDGPGIEREAAAIGAVAQQPELAGGQARERVGDFGRE